MQVCMLSKPACCLILLQRRTLCAGEKLLERYGMTETGMVVSNPYKGKAGLAEEASWYSMVL